MSTKCINKLDGDYNKCLKQCDYCKNYKPHIVCYSCSDIGGFSVNGIYEPCLACYK